MTNSTALLNDLDAAELLGVSPGTLRNWRYRGEGPPFIRYSRRAVRYDPADLAAWRDSRRVEPLADAVNALRTQLTAAG